MVGQYLRGCSMGNPWEIGSRFWVQSSEVVIMEDGYNSGC